MATRSNAAMARVEAIAQIVPTDATRWPDLVAALREAFDARGALLFTPEPARDIGPFGIAAGAVAEGMTKYLEHWLYQDAWNCAVAGTGFYQQAGEVYFGHDFTPDRALQRTAFFNDWARHYEAEQLVSVKLTDRRSRDAPVLHMTLLRRFADPAYGEADRAALRRLWPHLNRAACAAWALRPVAGGPQGIEHTLEFHEGASWIVRETGRVEFANQEARALGRTGIWAREQHGALVRIGQLERTDLQRRIARGAHRGDTVLVSAVQGGWLRPGTLRILPIVESPPYAKAWPLGKVLVQLQVPGPARGDLAAWTARLAAHYRLTEAQRAVLEGIGRGMTPEEIAQQRGVKSRTIQTQLGGLYARTGTARQVDLVRLVAGC